MVLPVDLMRHNPINGNIKNWRNSTGQPLMQQAFRPCSWFHPLLASKAISSR